MKPEPIKKRAGRPITPKEKKAVKPNVTIPSQINNEFRATAERTGRGYSEFLATAIIREIARVETAEANDLESRQEKTPALKRAQM